MLFRPEVSLVIPCFNEEARLQDAFNGAREALALFNESSEVIFVDDGSTDRTASMLSEMIEGEPCFRLLREPHRGKGGAIAAGVAASSKAIVLFADADWSMEPRESIKLLEALKESEIAIACREHSSSRRVDEPILRHLLGRAFNLLVRTVALPGVDDSQCGFKAFRAPVAKGLFGGLEREGWAFDVEILAKARRLGHHIATVPITWTHKADTRLRFGVDSVGMAIDVVRIGLRHRRG